VKIPKRLAGLKLKKRQRKQLRWLVDHMGKMEELLAVGSAMLAALGLASRGLARDRKQPGKPRLRHLPCELAGKRSTCDASHRLSPCRSCGGPRSRRRGAAREKRSARFSSG
jgi:hypothetical protein